MSLRLANVVFDCADPGTVAGFWSTALDRAIDPDPSPYFVTIGLADRDGPGGEPAWFFAKVQEGKQVKNRVHVDLTADDLEHELARLVAAGAVRVADKDEYGHRWTVLTDPEGNEFCVAAPPTCDQSR